MIAPSRRAMVSDHRPDPVARKTRVVAYLAARGVDLTGGRVVLVTLPRIFGYGFNPVSFYFCYERQNAPVAALTEVTNTFREMKPYFLGPDTRPPAAEGVPASFRHRTPKDFYVSPYSDVDVAFDFNLRAPGDQLLVQIDDYAGAERTLTSTVAGERQELTNARLAWWTLKYPLLTLRVIGLIHWHALRLWLKRLPWFAKAARADGQKRTLPAPRLTRPAGANAMNSDSLLAPNPASAAFNGGVPADGPAAPGREAEVAARSAAAGRRRPAPSLFRRLMLPMLAGMRRGRLRMEFPDGQSATFGAEAEGEGALPVLAPARPIARSAVIRVRREIFFRRCALYGDIGFAEAYLDGDWETPDLTAVIAWFILNIENAPTLSGSSRARSLALDLFRAGNRLGHLLRSNSRANARRNIGEHYDLSNEFFALFLDPTMMYSAAKWSQPGLTLEEAQREKNDALCRKLRLRPTDHVLEIGTGWGGWSIHAARVYGCRVTSVTISRQQYELARERIAAAGLADRIQVELRDYRDLTGQYDKLVSIEMMEAIGHRYLPEFCRGVARLLKPEGTMALQFITCPDARYDELRRGVDFIQKHIFPGSLLLSLNRVNGLMAKAGGFMLGGLEDLGPDYARTLHEWRDRFGARLKEVRALGFDERFQRKWNYYLEYCEAAFALRNISVVQAVYARPNHLES